MGGRGAVPEAFELAGFGADSGAEGEDGTGLDPGASRIAAVYAEAAILAGSRRSDGEAIVLTGHLFAAGGRLSEKSERKIQKGNLEAVSSEVFGGEAAYVALGHLHLAQQVGGRENVRYAGSPIPLSFDEAGYPHQVVLVELEGLRATSVEAIPVPRSVELLRLPESGPARLADLLPLLRALPAEGDAGTRGSNGYPFLEVRLLVEANEPSWRSEIDSAVAEKAVRLLRIDRSSTGTGSAAHEQTDRTLAEVTPEEVFRMKFAKEHGGEPSGELLAAFHELLAEAEAER